MEPDAFVAWLQGFMEACGDHPSAEQWARIKEQAKLVRRPLPDRYVPGLQAKRHVKAGERGDSSCRERVMPPSGTPRACTVAAVRRVGERRAANTAISTSTERAVIVERRRSQRGGHIANGESAVTVAAGAARFSVDKRGGKGKLVEGSDDLPLWVTVAVYVVLPIIGWIGNAAWRSFAVRLRTRVDERLGLTDAQQRFADGLAQRVKDLEARLDKQASSHREDLADLRNRYENQVQSIRDHYEGRVAHLERIIEGRDGYAAARKQ